MSKLCFPRLNATMQDPNASRHDAIGQVEVLLQSVCIPCSCARSPPFGSTAVKNDEWNVRKHLDQRGQGHIEGLRWKINSVGYHCLNGTVLVDQTYCGVLRVDATLTRQSFLRTSTTRKSLPALLPLSISALSSSTEMVSRGHSDLSVGVGYTSIQPFELIGCCSSCIVGAGTVRVVRSGGRKVLLHEWAQAGTDLKTEQTQSSASLHFQIRKKAC